MQEKQYQGVKSLNLYTISKVHQSVGTSEENPYRVLGCDLSPDDRPPLDEDLDLCTLVDL